MTTLLDKLKNELTSRPENILVLAGIGVSLATCPDTEILSWKGLLKNGLEWCVEIGVDESRLVNQNSILSNPASTANDFIGVGNFITEELRIVRVGEYGRWLAEVFKAITPKNNRLVRAIRSLGVKLATTNYDHLIEDVGGGGAITWREPGRSSEFFCSENNDVLHFHGSWLQPDSVILGLKSYGEICNDPYIQNELKACLTRNTIMFVGCGWGLKDPNFGTLLEWSRETLKYRYRDHFILVRSDEVLEWRKRLDGTPIKPIPYGQCYDELAPFIESLAQDVAVARERDQPNAKLLAAQSLYDARHSTLHLARAELTPADYLRQERTLAFELRKAGGNRQAAMAFSNAVTFRAVNISTAEFFTCLLDAAEMLLTEDLARMAANHLQTAEQLQSSETLPSEIRRLNALQVRCYAELSAYRQLLDAIARELPYADAERREELEAERAEASWLQGEYANRRSERTEP